MLIKKRYEIHYDIHSLDNLILEVRKKNQRIITILKRCVYKIPILDQLHILAHILNILNQNNIAVSRNETRRALNEFYNKEAHGEKRSYLNWLYKEFKIKLRTKIK